MLHPLTTALSLGISNISGEPFVEMLLFILDIFVGSLLFYFGIMAAVGDLLGPGSKFRFERQFVCMLQSFIRPLDAVG